MIINLIIYSLTLAKNENILILFNINLDFSIIKFILLLESNALSLALSLRRKKQAKDSNMHTVVRKLALLLCHDLPDIPNLIKAYGKRASKIAKNLAVNPQDNLLNGAF